MSRIRMDEEALQELFEYELESETELDFNEDHMSEDHRLGQDEIFHTDDGGRVYESIEYEIMDAVDEASLEDIPPDDFELVNQADTLSELCEAFDD